jgi:putative holliday junction resolvase
MDNSNSAIYIAFDFGMRHIGVAVGQKITKTATPLPILIAKSGTPNWQEIAALIKQWQPAAFVVGVPVHLDGRQQAITQAAKHFIEELREHFQLPVYSAEERLTTKDARERIFESGGYKALQHEPIDSIAAKIILESWFNQ